MIVPTPLKIAYIKGDIYIYMNERHSVSRTSLLTASQLSCMIAHRHIGRAMNFKMYIIGTKHSRKV